MKALEIFVLMVLTASLCAGIYVMLINLPMGEREYSSFSANLSGSQIYASGEITQFYPNMRYRSNNISYRLESTCPQAKWVDIERAFNILAERTGLSFYHSKDNPEIKVMCSELAPKSEEEGHFIAGEGGPSEIIDTGKFAVIFSGRIALYREEICSEPKVAIHEILHAMGFNHYNDSSSIMYPISNCLQDIDQEIVDDIKRLYSVKTLPDLAIESISANTTGRYLNFDVNVSNIGLDDSEGAQLVIYTDDEKIANFTLGDLEIGVRRILSVQNVRMPGGTDSVVFLVESDDAGDLNTENNRAELHAV